MRLMLKGRSMISILSDIDRNDLLAIATRFADRVKPMERDLILEAYELGAQMWLLQQADADGTVLTNQTGLLTEPKRVPATEVKPWECAGLFNQSELGLAVHLWLTGDPRITILINHFGVPAVMAVLATRYRADADDGSVITIHTLLVSALAAEAEFWENTCLKHLPLVEKARKADAARRLGPKVAAELRTRAAKEQDERLRRMAVEHQIGIYRDRRAYPPIHETVAYLQTRFNLTHETIKKKIRGVRTEAIRLVASKVPQAGHH